MPLSEHEQRILRQIEQELASDPTFADRAGRITRHRMMWLVLGIIVGLAVTVASLAVSAHCPMLCPRLGVRGATRERRRVGADW